MIDEKQLRRICGTSDPLSLKLQSGNVRRYHQEGRRIDQTVSEHTWRMLVFIHHVFPEASKELMTAAIFHDTPERVFGDISAPTKRAMGTAWSLEAEEVDLCDYLHIPHEKSLDSLNFARLKVADYLELVDFGVQNGRVRVALNGMEYVREWAAKLPLAEQIRVDEAIRTITSHIPDRLPAREAKPDLTGMEHPFGFQVELELSEDS